MREILFRGKRLDNGEWVEGWYEMYPFCKWPVKTSIIPSEEAKDGHYEHVQVDPSTVGQYTGMKDKNGKMIWEGDIIKWDYACNEGKSYQVIYDVGCACFVASREHNGNIIDTIFYNDGQHAEVISNIHDNPELLEK